MTVYRPQFFMHSLESPEALTLPQLRTMVTDQFIARNDERIAELNAERRPGRPKAKELLELEEIKRVESAEWETGFGESRREGHAFKVKGGVCVVGFRGLCPSWVAESRTTGGKQRWRTVMKWRGQEAAS